MSDQNTKNSIPTVDLTSQHTPNRYAEGRDEHPEYHYRHQSVDLIHITMVNSPLFTSCWTGWLRVFVGKIT